MEQAKNKRNDNWRNEEADFNEVLKNNPEIPRLELLKIDIQRRGVYYTDAALKLVDPQVHQTDMRYMFTAKEKDNKPVSITFRDGNSITNLGDQPLDYGYREPYIIDTVDGKPAVVDQDEVIEYVKYWTKPDYYNKKTSNGTPMWQVVNARPQRLDVMPNDQCHFWDKPGGGCKYCWAAGGYNKFEQDHLNCRFKLEDLTETIAEALKQPGRYSAIMFSGGSILTGKELCDDEVDLYVEVVNAVGKNFKTRKYPSQLISTAFNERQLKRLYDETGLMNYTADIEIPNRELFAWICPGKNEFVGYDEWKDRLYKAVEIFGEGNVNTGMVGGVELAKPNGFTTEEEGLAAILSEIEELVRHGVGIASGVWTTPPTAIFKDQITPSLDYYAKHFIGIDKLHRKYGINRFMDDYRRCGSHPSTDLGRM